MPYSEDKTSFNGRHIFIKDGYECIDDGHFRYVHRLIMEEHLGRPLESHEEVHHKDENKRHNEPSNFELTSKSEHSKHHAPEKFPYDATGSRNSQSKLTEEMVREIILKVNEERDIQPVADEYGVHYVSIWGIWKNRTWKHVER